MKQKITPFLFVCILLSAATGCSASSEPPEETITSDESDAENTSGGLQPFTAPVSFEAATVDGEAVTSDLFADSALTMINVWATYCNPCLSEMPDLGALASEYDASDFQIIGIISDVPKDGDPSALELAQKLIDETGADYPHLLLNESLYYGLLSDVTAVPTTFFIDSDGKILDTVIGSNDKDTWKEKIDALLDEM